MIIIPFIFHLLCLQIKILYTFEFLDDRLPLLMATILRVNQNLTSQ